MRIEFFCQILSEIFYIFLRRNSVGKVGGGCAFPGVATDVIPAVSQKQINLKIPSSSGTGLGPFKGVTK